MRVMGQGRSQEPARQRKVSVSKRKFVTEHCNQKTKRLFFDVSTISPLLSLSLAHSVSLILLCDQLSFSSSLACWKPGAPQREREEEEEERKREREEREGEERENIYIERESDIYIEREGRRERERERER